MTVQVKREEITYINITIYECIIFLPISMEGSGDLVYASKFGNMIVDAFINISNSNILESTSGVKIIKIKLYKNII